jgi:hypothetical protein
MIPHLDPDIAPPHLLRHGSRGAGAEETVEHEVARVGGDVQDAFKKTLGLWCSKCVVRTKKRVNFALCFIGVSE